MYPMTTKMFLFRVVSTSADQKSCEINEKNELKAEIIPIIISVAPKLNAYIGINGFIREDAKELMKDV